jgi:methylglyoxal/glyoxal reductase
MPKTEKVSRLLENIDVFDFQLTADEVKAINHLNKNERYLNSAEFTE